MIHISLNNSKLGDKIPSINLPVSICRADAPCKNNGCYACKGHFRCKTVQSSMNQNLLEYITDGDGFFNQIIDFLNNDDICYRFFRWFGSGDIVNKEFFNGMVNVAEQCPQTKFLAFTKKFDIVNEWLDLCGELPKNLKIVFSAWDKDFTVNNPHNLPVAYIDFNDKKKNAEIPEMAIPCVGKCLSCKSCWCLNKGQSVVFNKH